MNEDGQLLDDILRLQIDTHDVLKKMCGTEQNLLDTVTQLAVQLDDIRSRISALEQAIGANSAIIGGHSRTRKKRHSPTRL